MMRDSGVLYICELTNIACNGLMPKEVLKKVSKYWFEMRTVGINRQYLAKGVNEQVDLLVRIPRDLKVRIGEYVMLGNGSQYHIDNISHGHDESLFSRMVNQKYYKTARIVGLDYTELTLSKLENNYDVED